MLIGESKQEVKQRKHPFKSGDVVVCTKSSSTTHVGGEYKVMNEIAYLHKCKSYEDHWWDVDYFIIIKNDKGFTIKVNAINFKNKGQ